MSRKLIYLEDLIVEGVRDGFGMETVSLIESRMRNFPKNQDPAMVVVDSIGGKKGAADALRNVFQESIDNGVPVHGLVRGVCRSSAFYVLQSCSLRLAVPTAKLSIHDVKRRFEIELGVNDDPEVFGRQSAELARRYQPVLLKSRMDTAAIYQKRLSKFSIEEIAQMMSDNREWSAAEAFELGLIDEIVSIL